MLRAQNDDLRAQRDSWQGIAERLAQNAPKQAPPPSSGGSWWRIRHSA
jgi:hypothetical protein